MNVSGNWVKYNQLEEKDDEQLCRAAQDGNRAAEEILASRYHRLVRQVSRPYFLAGGDSEDLLQEGMFGLIKAIREYDRNRDATFHTFAETCIRCRLYTVLKAANSGKHIPLNQAVSLDPDQLEEAISVIEPDPEVLLLDREMVGGLLALTRQQLSDFEKIVLSYYIDGLTYLEIARTIGKSPKSIDNAIQRIRRKIGRLITSGDISKG